MIGLILGKTDAPALRRLEQLLASMGRNEAVAFMAQAINAAMGR